MRNQTWIRLALMLIVVAAPCAFGQVERIRDAPFFAVVRDEKKLPIMQIARAGDGSTYSGSNIVDGKPTQITIDDVSRHCKFTATLLTTPSNGPRPVFWLSPVTPEMHRVNTVDDIRDRFKKIQEHMAGVGDRPKLGDSSQRISLGEKNVGGMTLFGFHYETKMESGDTQIQEKWESDLGFSYSQHFFDASTGLAKVEDVTDFRVGEPDQNLFQIAPNLFPTMPEFVKAKTLFLESSRGQKELADEVVEILTGSGKLSMIANRHSADLIVTFTFRATADEIHVASLEFRAPGSATPLFVISMLMRGPLESLPETVRGESCLSTLWAGITDAKIAR